MKGSGSKTAVGSAIEAGRVTLDSAKDINIEGSEITAGSADVKAAGDINVTSAQESSYEYSVRERTKLSINKELALAAATGGASLIFTPNAEQTIKDNVNLDRGRVSVTVAKGEYEKTENRTDSITQKSSSINTAEELTMQSGRDTTPPHPRPNQTE